MLHILLEVIVKVTHWLTRVSACSAIYQVKAAYKSHSLQPKGYFHATYSAGSDSESDSFVDESLGMQPNSNFHATYHAGSVSESNSLVHKSHRLQPKGYFPSMLLILLK